MPWNHAWTLASSQNPCPAASGKEVTRQSSRPVWPAASTSPRVPSAICVNAGGTRTELRSTDPLRATESVTGIRFRTVELVAVIEKVTFRWPPHSTWVHQMLGANHPALDAFFLVQDRSIWLLQLESTVPIFGEIKIYISVLRLYPDWNRCRSQACGKFFFRAMLCRVRYCHTKVVRL